MILGVLILSGETMTNPNGNYAYDLEVTPNFFSATFVNLYSDDVHAFVIHPSRDQRYALVDFLSEVKGLVGFNSIFFDSALLRYFIQYHVDGDLNNHLFQMAQRLISDKSYEDDQIRQLRFPKKSDWRDLDLMKMQSFDKLGIPLKQVAINLRWHRILDLPFAYDAEISAEQIQIVLDYNLNDTLITKALFHRLQPEIQLRKEIKKVYGIDASSASDSKIANLMLESMITDDKDELKAIRLLRTHRQTIKIADCIPHDVRFSSLEICGLLDRLLKTNVSSIQKFRYQASLKFDGHEYQLGIGGLHSEDGAGDFQSDESSLIRDADVASYYPSIILKLGIRPAHLDERFDRVFRKMTEDRLAAKHVGDTARANALKITINSVFGKLESETFWLYDPMAFLRVTIAGQLYLLMLVESLHLAGIETLSANTDGIICRIPRNKLCDYQEVTEDWQRRVGFELEFSDYSCYVRRDVNNYIAIKPDGKTKEKGVFAEVKDLKKGFKFPIIQKCLYQYFVHGKSIEDTLNQNRDILDYATSQKTGSQFKLEYHTFDGIQVLQRNNRYAINTKGGALLKRHRGTGKTTSLNAGELVVLLNDVNPNDDFESYQIDFDFYKREVEKIINMIEPKVKQLMLF